MPRKFAPNQDSFLLIPFKHTLGAGSLSNTVEETARLLGRNRDIRFDRLMPGYHDRLEQSRAGADNKRQPISNDFGKLVVKLCAFFVVVTGLIYVAAGYYGSLIAMGSHTSSTTLRQIVIGSDVVTVPENMIRFSGQRKATELSRLDLHTHWPSMTGYDTSLIEAFNSTDPATPILYVALEPRDMAKDMSGRISSIYEKFFSGPPVEAGNGLVRRAFSTQSAYFSEDLYYEAGSPYPFAARCIRESEQMAGEFCIRDIHIGRDMMLTYRFHKSLLPEWMAMDSAVRRTFTAMLAQ